MEWRHFLDQIPREYGEQEEYVKTDRSHIPQITHIAQETEKQIALIAARYEFNDEDVQEMRDFASRRPKYALELFRAAVKRIGWEKKGSSTNRQP
jgi:hypothetical protein